MNSVLVVLSSLVPIGLGWLMQKFRPADRFFNILKVLSVWVILPLIAFMYVGGLTPREIGAKSGSVVLAAIASSTCFFVTIPFTLKLPREEGAALLLNSSFGNVGHLGLPIVFLKFGPSAMPAAVLYSVTVAILNLFMGTLLLHLLLSTKLRFIFVQTLTFPALVLLLVAVGMVYAGAPVPPSMVNFFSCWIFPVFGFLLLLQVGYYLRFPLAGRYALHLPLVGSMRFVLSPLTTLALAELLGLHTSPILGPALVLSATPPAVFNMILAQLLGLDSRPYSLTFFSLTLVSLPILWLL